MGTTSRAFDSNKKVGLIGGGNIAKLSFVAALSTMFGGLGSLFSGAARGSGMKEVAFSTPNHSPHNCGRRTSEQVAQRKARRQKRQRLILKRGYA